MVSKKARDVALGGRSFEVGERFFKPSRVRVLRSFVRYYLSEMIDKEEDEIGTHRGLRRAIKSPPERGRLRRDRSISPIAI